MRGGGYGRVPYPWRASVDLSAPEPALFFGSLVQQAVRYGSPARRRFGPLMAMVARAGLPPPRAAAAALRLQRHERPDLNELKGRLVESWLDFAPVSNRLPKQAPQLTVLELERAAARTVLVFAGSSTPVIVVKFARDLDRVEREAEGLRAAASAAIAPLYLGRLDEAHLQEGLAGRAMHIDAVTPSGAAALRWQRSHEWVAEGLMALTRATAHEARPMELQDPSLERAVEHPSLKRETAAALGDALSGLRGFNRAVLKHGDTSAQNCLIGENRLEGLIDWENCKLHGAPGFDIYNSAVSVLEHGVALTRWSEERVSTAFERAWKRSTLFDKTRSRASEAAHAAGASSEEAEALQKAFFLRRFAQRLERPHAFATSANLAGRMLEVACEH